MWLKLVLKKKGKKACFPHSFAICFPQNLLTFTLAMNVNKIASDFVFHRSVCMLICTYIHIPAKFCDCCRNVILCKVIAIHSVSE